MRAYSLSKPAHNNDQVSRAVTEIQMHLNPTLLRHFCPSRWFGPLLRVLMLLLLLVGCLCGAAGATPAPAGTILRVVATATYIPTGYTQTETVSSNGVVLTVQSVEAIALTQDQALTRPPGMQVVMSHLLTNTGNVRSSYKIGWSNGGAACPSSAALSLSGLQLVRDSNGNGVVDAGEAALPLNTAGAFSLDSGESVTLLAVGTMPTAASGAVCATLTASTGAQAVSASNMDVIEIGNAAVLSLIKSASYTAPLQPGVSRIDYVVNGTNVGNQAAQATGTAVPANTPIVVDGSPVSAILVRDVLPAGTRYMAGSLQSSMPGALRLFRLPGDAAFSYRTSGGDDASAIEVAAALLAPATISPNASLQMRLSATVTASAGNLLNTAQAYFNDGTQATSSSSNTQAISVNPARIGVAEAASLPRPNADGTSDVTLSLRVKNYGTSWLYDVQLLNVLEGAGATQFGTYSTSASPAVGQYTIVPGSLKIAQPSGSVGGQSASVSSAFDGTSSRSSLLAPGAVLPVGGDLTLQFVVRFNTAGRPSMLYTSSKAQAATVAGSSAVITDDSVNGSDPDPDGDGNPGNNGSPTPVGTQSPLLALSKSASPPRYVSAGVYDVDFLFKVSNTGSSEAPNVRVIDNLNCAFSMDQASGPVAQWELRGPVRSGAGILAPSANFTGAAGCNRSQWNSADPTHFPTEIGLNLTDGSRPLPAGSSEQLGFTVRVTLKGDYAGGRVTYTNKGWAASLMQNTINVDPTQVAGASAASAVGLLVDPQGTVYDAVSRSPIVGAVVTIKRQSCTGGTAGAITADQVLGGNSGIYTFNADGTMSMTTGTDGSWQFYWLAPPISGKCAYSLSVTPPANSGYIYPSQRIPAQGGSFATCGAVTPNALSPANGEATTWYTTLEAGFNSDGSACDVVHNHIPLDPGLINGLVLRKAASKQQVEFGDFLDYALTVTNKTGFPLKGVNFSDTLPAGFAYVPGSSRLNGNTVANPSGGVGPTLAWQFPDAQLAADQSVMVRYRVRVGVGARVAANATNRAQASTTGFTSNTAEHTVRVNGGVFSDEAFAFGKVYMDCRSDRQQDGEDEPGVPGVRLWLEDGTNVITDGEGRWSLYGLKPMTHVLRLDETTLPVGAKVLIQDNRNAGTAASRFVDLKKGEFHKANFPLQGCDDAQTTKDVEARRKAAAKNLDAELAGALRNRLDPKAQTIVASDTRALPAAGQINGTGAGAGASLTATTGPLISLPGAPQRAAGAGGGNFLDGTGTVGGSGTLAVAQQVRAMPATGQVPSAGIGDQSAGQPGSVTQGLVPQPMAPSVIELEKLLPDLDNKPGFVELRNGDTLPGQAINVRVKGPAGAVLQLSVNGEAVDARRVGKKTTLPATQTSAWEYIGVQFKPGNSRLRLQVTDEMGNSRGEAVEISVTAPDKLGVVRLEVPKDSRADARTPVPVHVVLTDAAGVPVTARTAITLESDAGRWQEEDLNDKEPGLQSFIEGGRATYHLVPPGTPGDVRVRATVNGIVQEVRLVLLPDLRPMIAVGVVEGTLDLTKRGKLGIDQLPAGAAFEQELSSLGSNGDTKNTRAGGRAAFFLKGAIKGEYLLTASLDTAKSNKDRLFRDIRPDEFYPVYGDASERGYDAQSSQKLYVRIDKNRSYLLYGDFQTSSSTEVRKLSQTNRTLTGAKGVYDEDRMRITAYGSRTSQTQQIEEFAGRGISGPYYLAGNLGDMVENSETVEIVSRDRNQSNVILKATTLARFVDYTLEPNTRRLMFVSPVSAVDANLNPQSVRVTYEVDAGGPKYTVAGVDAQFKVGERVQAGVVAHVDEDPKNPRRLAAVTGLARLGDNTSMATEAVRTHSDEKGSGSAGRIELRHQTENLGVSAQAARASSSFDNPAAGFGAGTTEASVRAEYRIDSTLAARAEALYSKNDGTSASANGTSISTATAATPAARGQSVSLLKRFNDYFSAEVGLRHGATASSSSASMFSYDQVSSYSSTLGSSQMGSSVTALGAAANSSGSLASDQNDLTTVRGRLTATLPGVPQAQVFVEGEQDTNDSGRHMAAVGGNYAITDKTRVYGRYELSSTLYEDSSSTTSSSRNVGILGVESAYMEGGRVYNEYRLADADSSRTAQIANGIRNTIKLGEHWSVTGGIERTRALGTVSSTSLASGLGSSTAVTSGVEYTNGAFRASGILEKRTGSDADTVLNSMGMGYRLNDEWTLLARSVYSSSKGVDAQQGNDRIQSRQQIGAAYRPKDDDRFNALARYEHRSETIRGSTATAGSISGNAFGSDASLPGSYKADIASVHANFSPDADNTVSGRLAMKRSSYDDGSLKSSYTAQLLYARWTRDLNAKWDMSVQGGLLHGSGGALQKSLGLELGYQVMKDLWLSIGYNALGLSDRDLTAGEYTSKGAYFRLRFKFDETGLGFARSGADQPGSAVGAASLSSNAPSKPIEEPPRIDGVPAQAPRQAAQSQD
ncbi:putative repeat protein (TIGR01451 family) [Pseudacidovorax intermedius]|uniref:Putative repeat protein (TIGR01451 family) n=1 Tax=Pseudacidovorax intermedius TaxID=433924 RepID=A0A370FJ69_9BURK|nr:DUF11 domain-containing protein [Pseudacidovorax intermedius]RDI25849.1 putative repeat protein (TIGR01451 family) [Pseudacidovorax intermedius]